jgi:hypothetical protein
MPGSSRNEPFKFWTCPIFGSPLYLHFGNQIQTVFKFSIISSYFHIWYSTTDFDQKLQQLVTSFPVLVLHKQYTLKHPFRLSRCKIYKSKIQFQLVSFFLLYGFLACRGRRGIQWPGRDFLECILCKSNSLPFLRCCCPLNKILWNHYLRGC